MSKEPNAWKSIVSGTCGGIGLTLVGHPLDTIKVRLQTQPTPKPGEKPMFSGTWDCAVKTIKKEKLWGLYKGISSPLYGQAFLYAICFGSYGWARRVQMDTPESQLNLFQIFNAGCFSGVASTIIMTPMELVKIQMQVQYEDSSKARYKNPLDCMVQIYKKRGIAGIYRGTTSTLVRDVPGSGVYFAGYEIIKRMFIPKDGTAADLQPWHYFMSGGLAGLSGWMFMLPLDTVKSRVQAAPEGTYRGFFDCYKHIIKSEGIPALWKGLGAVSLRAFPANAACFFCVEMANRFLNKLTG
mmetsp:Transcript_13956/g.21120  ORF Transcript_13956/g.21120 Transcript_13956/m.21120 type:complete len:297 (+) Transcript_13956:42-932(+)